MKNTLGVIRAFILIVMGIYIISLSIFIMVICFYGCFFKQVIRLYEYVLLELFNISYVIVYVFIFRYFMIQRVYDVKKTGEKYITLKTQFKEICFVEDKIIKKSLTYCKTYKLKVSCDSKDRTFFIPCKFMDIFESKK